MIISLAPAYLAMLLSSYAAYAMLYYALVWGAMKFWVLEFE